MKHSTCTCQTTQLETRVAELTEQLEAERSYSTMLELDMEAKIAASVDVQTKIQVQGTLDDLKRNTIVANLMKYRADGYEVVQVAT